MTIYKPLITQMLDNDVRVIRMLVVMNMQTFLSQHGFSHNNNKINSNQTFLSQHGFGHHNNKINSN